MLQELVQVERLSMSVLTVVRVRQAALVNVLYPPLNGYLGTALEAKLE
jgi:hypothetical protein